MIPNSIARGAGVDCAKTQGVPSVRVRRILYRHVGRPHILYRGYRTVR